MRTEAQENLHADSKATFNKGLPLGADHHQSLENAHANHSDSHLPIYKNQEKQQGQTDGSKC